MSHSVVKTTHIEWLVGALAAILLLIGRWSPLRLINIFPYSSTIFLEPRFWITSVLFIIFLLPTRQFRASWVSAGCTGIIFIFLLLAFMLLSILWAVEAELAWEKGYEIVLMAIGIASIAKWVSFADGEHIRNVFWKTLINLSLILAVVAVISVLSAPSASPTLRIAVLAGGPNAFGRIMGLLCLGGLGLVFKTQRWVVWLPVSVMAFFLLILTGSRGALIASVIGITVFILVGRIRITRFIIVGAIASAIAVVILWYTPLGQTTQRMFQLRVNTLLIEEQYISGRESIYLYALAMGQENLLFGAGLASFEAVNRSSYPHNLFLEIFSEGGLVASGLLSAILISFVLYFRKMRRWIDPVTVGACALAFAFSQASGDLYDSRMVFFLLIFSLICYPCRDIQRQTS